MAEEIEKPKKRNMKREKAMKEASLAIDELYKNLSMRQAKLGRGNLKYHEEKREDDKDFKILLRDLNSTLKKTFNKLKKAVRSI